MRALGAEYLVYIAQPKSSTAAGKTLEGLKPLLQGSEFSVSGWGLCFLLSASLITQLLNSSSRKQATNYP